MIYSKILDQKYKKLLSGLAIVMLLLFSLTLNSCYTYKTEYYSPEELRTKDDYTVKILTLNNDSNINLEKQEITYLQNTDKSQDVFQWLRIDTVFIKLVPEKEFKINNSVSEIRLDSILKAKVETKKFNLGKTMLYSGGIIAGLALILTIVALIDPPKMSGGVF